MSKTAIKTNFRRPFDVRLERTQIFSVMVDAKDMMDARRAATAKLIAEGPEKFLIASDALNIVEIKPLPLRAGLATPKIGWAGDKKKKE